MAYRKMNGLDGKATDTVVERLADGAIVPADPANTDWQAYQAWLAAGNVPAEAARERADPAIRRSP